MIVVCATSAGIHAALAPAHFHELRPAGLGFAVSAVALALVATGLARSRSVLLIDAAAVVLGALLLAYVGAITTGVPGLVPEPEPVDALAVATKAIEAVGLAAAFAARRSRAPVRLHSVPLVAAVVASSALVVLPFAGSHHKHDGDHPAHDRAAR